MTKPAFRPVDIEMHSVILNGEPDESTYREYREKGYIILDKDRAKKYHPYAMDTDTILFVAKPIDKEKYDEYMDNWRKESAKYEAIALEGN